MPARRIPPLNALRAFEAAARHLSFTVAAQELNVTQAAISHQVKALEEHLGIQLFRRRNRSLELTDAGFAYLPSLTQAFDLVETASRKLLRQEAEGPLKISVLPSFATKWLLPRLPLFREAHPEIDVLVSARDELVDFYAEQIDLGIRYGRGEYPGLSAEWMMADYKYPVCSPQLLKGELPLSRPEDLRYQTLLHDDVTGGAVDIDWGDWLGLAQVDNINFKRGPGYNDSSMVINAAIAGQGIALARHSLAQVDMDNGLLVSPFGPQVATGFHYFIVTAPETKNWPKIKAFRNWLLEEVAACGMDSPPPAGLQTGEAMIWKQGDRYTPFKIDQKSAHNLTTRGKKNEPT
ncbi:transcriptional regulator GcvA [Rhodovibrionaceae bacterium A322]